MLKPTIFTVIFALVSITTISACAALLTPAPSVTVPVADGGQPSAPATIQTTSTLAPWQIQATAEAGSTSAAAAYTAVAEYTRLAGEAQAARTQAAQQTHDALALTPAAATAAALERQIASENFAATRSAGLTQVADTFSYTSTAASATGQALATAEAYTATAQNIQMLATESAQREANATTTQQAIGMIGALAQCLWVLAAIAFVIFLLYAAQELLPVLKFGLKTRLSLLKSGPAPMQALQDQSGNIYIVLISAQPPQLPVTASNIIEQTAPPTNKPARAPGVPAFIAIHPDDPAAPLKRRILNLLAAAMQVAGQGGQTIPRYDKIGFDAQARQTLTHVLEQAGLATIGNETRLTGNRTLYSLYVEIETGRQSLAPNRPTAIETAPLPVTQDTPPNNT